MKNHKKQFVIIGLGRFGYNVALTLNQLGCEILAIDINESIVQNVSNELQFVVCANGADEKTLRSLGVVNADIAIVAIGDLEPNLMATLLLKEMGVPKVVTKAVNDLHGKMLEKIGADQIIYSEKDMGKRVAHNLVSSNIVDYIEISDLISLMSLKVPTAFLNKTIIEANIRQRYQVNIVAIKRGAEPIVNPDPYMKLVEGDEIIVVGQQDNIRALEESI